MICLKFFLKKFRKWRIRSQIFFVQFTTITLVILILGICIICNFIGIFKILENGAQQQLIMKFIYSSTNSQLQAYKDNLKSKLNEGMNSIENFNRLSQLIYETKMNFSYMPEQCLQEHISYSPKMVHLNQFCFGIFDCSNEINVDRSHHISDMLKLSALMTSLTTFLDGPYLYFTLISQKCYFSYYPGNDFDNFVPSSRPWFKNYVANQNQSTFVFSDPYISYFNGIYQTISGGIQDQSKNIIGIGGFDLNFTTVYPQMPEDQQFLVINSYGDIIVSKLYNKNSSEVYSLYNQSLFGFIKQDVEKIINFDKKQDSSCQIPIPDTICAIDKNSGQQWYIRKTYITKQSILLIMFTSESYRSYLDLLSSTIYRTYQKNLQHLGFWVIILSIVCLIIYLITQIILYRPIDKLINSFNKCLISGKKKQYLIFNPATSDQLDKLSEAFVRLTSQSDYHKIDYQCIFDKDTMEFPQNHYRNSKIQRCLEDIFVIKQIIQNLEDFEDQFLFVNEFHKNYTKSIVSFETD